MVLGGLLWATTWEALPCCNVYRFTVAPYETKELESSAAAIPSYAVLSTALFHKDYPYEPGYSHLNNLSVGYYLDYYPCSVNYPIKSEQAQLLYCYAAWKLQAIWPAAEAAIAEDPFYAYLYAKNLLKSRWPQAEAVIASDARAAYLYARDVLKGPWPQAEPVIARNPRYAFNYALTIKRRLWPLGEAAIVSSPKYAYLYARDVRKSPWPALEARGLSYYGAIYQVEVVEQRQVMAAIWPGEILAKAKQAGQRWREAEPHLLDKTFGYSSEAYFGHHGFIIDYSETVVKARWAPAEQVLLRDASLDELFAYQRRVINGPWPALERYLEKLLGAKPKKATLVKAFWYAQKYKRGRWPELEPLLSDDPYIWRLYARRQNAVQRLGLLAAYPQQTGRVWPSLFGL